MVVSIERGLQLELNQRERHKSNLGEPGRNRQRQALSTTKEVIRRTESKTIRKSAQNSKFNITTIMLNNFWSFFLENFARIRLRRSCSCESEFSFEPLQTKPERSEPSTFAHPSPSSRSVTTVLVRLVLSEVDRRVRQFTQPSSRPDASPMRCARYGRSPPFRRIGSASCRMSVWAPRKGKRIGHGTAECRG